MYYYEPRNKFPHLVLIEEHSDWSEEDQINDERLCWLRENIGKHGKDWSTVRAHSYNGKKFYWTGNTLTGNQRMKVKLSKQFGFKDKETAMRFKLLCL